MMMEEDDDDEGEENDEQGKKTRDIRVVLRRCYRNSAAHQLNIFNSAEGQSASSSP